MEGVKNGNHNNNDKKKQNTVVSFNGGGGIGGLVVLGGAIAFAALFTFVANKRNKSKPITKKDQCVDSDSYRESNLKIKTSYRADIGDDEIESEGLQLLIQPDSDPTVYLNLCDKSNDKAEMGFHELSTTQNSIMEEIRLSETNGVKETETQQNGDHDNIFQSDLINPEDIISLRINKGEENENQNLQVIETSSAPEEEMEAEAEAEPMLLELIEEEKQEEGISDTSSSEDNPSTESTEAENEDNGDDDDDDEDKEEESKGTLEETGDSSTESNAEPIWPTETLENLSMKLKENNFSHQDLVAEKIRIKDVTDKNDISNQYDELIAPRFEERLQVVPEYVSRRGRVGTAVTMMLVMGMIMLSLIELNLKGEIDGHQTRETIQSTKKDESADAKSMS